MEKEKWWKMMIEKYGSREAVREAFKAAGHKGKGVKRGSGFTGDPERAAEAGKAGAESRWNKK